VKGVLDRKRIKKKSQREGSPGKSSGIIPQEKSCRTGFYILDDEEQDAILPGNVRIDIYSYISAHVST